MKIIPENNQDITTIIASEFRCFGDGDVNSYNPISIVLQDKPASFAAGVDVQEVVDRVVELFLESRRHTTDPDNIDWSDIDGEDVYWESDEEDTFYKKSKY